ncbi:peptidyl-prolyl cis-trans isomerase CWC27 homolog isoform X2 [Cimex lectularius]|uniref:Spliceosome-associated protein CWC27 homolog n=1 Tax=Cimex lectularius TaxID=79782 RepID=A0A8I6SGU0_CIMLE|nr:peptidyl-prolyl cis-trans isomerase CWC27 homolog isoform X2 [Cimex lectularius]
MSTIYIQEPPTYGKVLLKTTVGDIDIELWSKEAPLACRNFVQLCMENYYNNTTFHRVIKGFIAQGGDPTGTGNGGESIYGEPFKDEFHTRLRFNKRGLVAMANAGKNDNGSQFFFTLGATPELQNKHTIFGKVGGDTIYNMIKLEEGEIVDEDRPVYPQKINSTEILLNPFTDIVPRERELPKIAEKPQKKKEIQGVKDFKLLSFGDEAEEDEETLLEANKEYSNKSKAVPGLVEEPLPVEPEITEPKLTGLEYVRQKLSKKSGDTKQEEKTVVQDSPTDKSIIKDKAETDTKDEETPDNTGKTSPDSSESKPSVKKDIKKAHKRDKSSESNTDDEMVKRPEKKKVKSVETSVEVKANSKKHTTNEEYLALTNMYAHLKRTKSRLRMN